MARVHGAFGRTIGAVPSLDEPPSLTAVPDPSDVSVELPIDVPPLTANEVSQAPAAAYTARTGLAGDWLYASPQIETILGYTAEEFCSDPHLWARLLHPEDRDRLAAEESGLLEAEGVTRSYSEYRMVDRRGRTVWVLDDVTAVPDPELGSVQHGLLLDITARKSAELLLAEQAGVLELVATQSPVPVTLEAVAAAVVRVSDARSCTARLGSGEEIVVGPATEQGDELQRVAFGEPGTTAAGELLVDGAELSPELQAWSRRLAEIAVDGAVQRSSQERGLALLSATLESTADGILVVDGERRVVRSNRKFRELWNLADTGEEFCEFRVEDITSQVVDVAAFMTLTDAIHARPTEASHDEVSLRDGRRLERNSEPHIVDGRAVGRVWSFRDITTIRQMEEQLRRQAFADALTGLPNRHRFVGRLREIAGTDGDETPLPGDVGLILIDLDDFKVVNDSLGHLAGDEVLVEVGRRFAERVRGGDMVARIGGDEFAVVISRATGHHDLKLVADRLLDALVAPVRIADRSLRVRASIGVALADGATGGRDLLRNADLAMYEAKRAGGSRSSFYDISLHRAAVARLDLKASLESALDQTLAGRDAGLWVAYQPVVMLPSGDIRGFEALLRWDRPQGAVATEAFIRLAEETGLICRLGAWVLDKACADLASWLATYEGRPTLKVNVSPRQLEEPDFAEIVQTTLDRHCIPPELVCLEVTESALRDTEDEQLIDSWFADLRAYGVRLALDDFGTGHSSLARLGNYPFSILKLDRSFVSRIACSHRDRAVVEAVLRLSEAFGMGVIAEGVETQEQAATLAELGCSMAQGFWFSRPVPAANVAKILAEADHQTTR